MERIEESLKKSLSENAGERMKELEKEQRILADAMSYFK